MSPAQVLALIIAVAVQEGVPPNFAVAIAVTENPSLSTTAVSARNRDGSRDHGVMQLNDKYFSHLDMMDPEVNVRAGIKHIKYLLSKLVGQTYWDAAIAYNAGLARVKAPPWDSVDYATKVIATYSYMQGGYINPIIQVNGKGGYK